MGKETIRRSLKTIAMNFPDSSIERVYLHGLWQKERGRKATMLYGNHTDARQAFRTASDMVGQYIDSIRALPFSRNHDWSDWIQDIMNKVPPDEL